MCARMYTHLFQLEDGAATPVTCAKQGWEAIDKANDVLRSIHLLPAPDKIAGCVHVLKQSSVLCPLSSESSLYIGLFI